MNELVLNTWFSSVFIPPLNNSPPNVQPYNGQSLANIHLTDCEVAQALQNLDPNKACGPDNIPGRILKETAREITSIFCRLFNLSLTLGVFPAAWKRAKITPIFKQEDPSLPSNYRPISLLCITSKIFERCVFNHCYNHLSQFLSESQHGFVKGRSTETQLLETYHYILHSLAKGKEVDVLYLDLSKAFDKVDHSLLLAKLKGYGISAPLLKWFRSYLADGAERVVLEGVYSNWLPVTSGVPQGSILGPLLFLVFVNNMPDYVCSDSKLALFADDSKLYRTLESPRSQSLLQQDLDGLYKWSLDSNMTFNLSKCKALHVSKKKSPSVYLPYRLANDNLECASLITDLGISISCDLQWKYHIRKMITGANRKLGLIKRVCRLITNRYTRKILFCALVVRPRLEYCSSLWSPSVIKYRALIENVQRRATKFILNYPSRDAFHI